MTKTRIPQFAFSVCFDLESLPPEFYESKCYQEGFVNLSTSQTIDRLFKYRLTMHYLVPTINNKTSWYFRNNRLCFRKQIKQIVDDRFLEKGKLDFLFQHTLQININGRCYDAKCFF